MKLRYALIIIVATTFLTACGQSNEDSASIETTDELKELVNDYSTGNINKGADHQASITAQELIISDGDSQDVYDLPEDDFFVSIAPFINETHP